MKSHEATATHLHSHLLLLSNAQATQAKAKESASQRTDRGTELLTNFCAEIGGHIFVGKAAQQVTKR